jgi:rod shape-determining protein MreC
MIFPRGLPVGVVEKVVRDPERDSFIEVIVKPSARLDRLDEVLVITDSEPRFSPEQQQDLTASEALKGPEAAAIAAQKKATEEMAARLPGLTDPNLPPDQQPLLDNSNPNPVAHPPQALHPDRFTPGAAAEIPANANPASSADASPVSHPAAKLGHENGASQSGGAATKPAPKSESKPGQPAETQQANPGRNP